MKNNNFISFVTVLVIGLIVGGGVIGLIWHNSLKTPKEITAKEKQIYLKTPLPPGHFFRITLFKSQYDAMTKLLSVASPKIPPKSFKLYRDMSNSKEILVKGLDKDGNDDSNPFESSPLGQTTVGQFTPNFIRIYLTMEQYTAMTNILQVQGLPMPVAGFRLYPVSVVNGPESIVICGIDANGDDILETIQNSTCVEPCPPNCDCL